MSSRPLPISGPRDDVVVDSSVLSLVTEATLLLHTVSHPHVTGASSNSGNIAAVFFFRLLPTSNSISNHTDRSSILRATMNGNHLPPSLSTLFLTLCYFDSAQCHRKPASQTFPTRGDPHVKIARS